MTLLNRCGVLGDVHTEARAVEAALALFRAEQVDRALCVGDVVDGPGDVVRAVELLRAAGVDCVRGNHERWFLKGELRDLRDATVPGALPPDASAWLKALPATREYETVRGSLLLCHGLGDDDMARFSEDAFGYELETNDALQELLRHRRHAVVVSGHSHRRMVRTLGGVVFVNAGTLLRTDHPCAAVVDLAAARVRYFNWAGEAFGAGEERVLEFARGE